jgi:putative YhbY family RNA-binding protein
MAELSLPQEACTALRAQAHRLNPVVLLGAAGLSEAALREIDRALSAHGLVKVRAGKLERDARDALFGTMADRLGAARVQAIGHTFVLFRPIPQKKAAPHTAPVKSARSTGARAPAARAGARRPR